MLHFLLLYCSLQDQWLDTAYSPDSANYLEASTYSGQWTLKHALVWLTKDKLKLVPWSLSASISSIPLRESPNYQGILPSLLSSSQRQLCSSTQPYKVRALASHNLTSCKPPWGWRRGLAACPVTANHNRSEDHWSWRPKIPSLREALAWDLPQGVTHECTRWCKTWTLHLRQGFLLSSG